MSIQWGNDYDHLLVVAIDLGTTFSGYAFSFIAAEKEIQLSKLWNGSVKTPTSVLVNAQGKFDAFGFEAEEKYSNLPEHEVGYELFKHFKMRLHDTGVSKFIGVSRESTVESVSGKKRNALDIFSMALKYLKDHLLETIEKQTRSKYVTPDMIRWVLTVPAIWNDEAKQFMREAAYKGGLITSIGSNNLLIALEPEAASLYCKTLKTLHCEGQIEVGAFKPGVKYMVVDVGGGAIDTTVHEVLDEERFKELGTANGGACGGTSVDKELVKLLEKVLGPKFLATFQSKYSNDWFELISNIERGKKCVTPDRKTISLLLPWSIFRVYQEAGSNFEEAFRKANVKGVSFSNGKLSLQVSDLFNQAFEQIVSHITKQLEKNKDIQFFLLVGGFAECQLLQQAIKDAFCPKVKVFVPPEPRLAVIKGAIVFGHKPRKIAKKTYGTSKSSDFDSTLHDIKYMEVNDGIKNCTELFEVWIQKGAAVEIGHTLNFEYSPVTDKQSQMAFQIYAIDRQCSTSRPEYVDTPGFEKVGKVTVDMAGYGKDREVDLEVVFGGTEIQVTAKDRASGKNASVKIDK